MDDEKRQRVITVLKAIEEDAEQNTRDREGQPVTGQNLGRWLRETNAMIAALARAVRAILEDE